MTENFLINVRTFWLKVRKLYKVFLPGEKNFLKTFLWTRRLQFLESPWKKSDKNHKFVAQNLERDLKKTLTFPLKSIFHRNVPLETSKAVLINSRKFFTKGRKLFAQSSKSQKYIYFLEKIFFHQNVPITT